MEKGSSSSSSGGGAHDSINGLKFGKKIYFEGLGSTLGGGGLLTEEEAAPPPRSPAKKGRIGVVHGGQPPRCQVEGCMVDLSDSKAYYCRHKVCGLHSKSPMVIVAGLEQRFCQQCSRFHQLPEFDQGKRSCRRRLAGHNERRRKPPPGPLASSYASRSPSIFDDHTKTGGLETELSAYSAFAGRDSWPNTSKRGLSDQATSTGSFQLPWQISSQASTPSLVHGPTTTRSRYTVAEDCFSRISDSTSALSLLSNELWGSRSQALDLGVNTFLATNGTAGVQPASDSGAPIGRYSCPSWEFRSEQDDHSLHEMLHEMGLAQISHSHPTNNPYSRDHLRPAQPIDGKHHELELSGGFDSSGHHMNWSL